MELILICICVYMTFIFFELIPLYRKKQYKLLTIYSIILGISLIIEMGVLMGMKVPSMSVAISNIINGFIK